MSRRVQAEQLEGKRAVIIPYQHRAGKITDLPNRFRDFHKYFIAESKAEPKL
jgi:hypothetical protein